MKLTTVLLLATFLQVSATGFAQRVTLTEKGVSLEHVFKEIMKQTGYNFVMSAKKVDINRAIDVSFSDTPLDEAIQKCLSGFPLTYTIFEKTIVIRNEDTPIINLKSGVNIIEQPLVQQKKDVWGWVLDSKDKPIPGVTVTEKGTRNSTVTKENGRFELKNVSSDAVLVASFIGYQSKEIDIKGTKASITFHLAESNTKLEGVTIVSTGYQTLAKERATGSFEKVDNELLNRSPGLDVISRLKGVTTSTVFGNPNNVPTNGAPVNNTVLNNSIPGNTKVNSLNAITIRGISTLNTVTGGMFPLVVLDNFPYDGDINNINPNDIESVTLLKDAAAASIWGIRASNGVIVIITKKAKYEQPLRITLNSNITIGEKPNLFYQKQMSSSDYIDVEKFLFNKNVFNSKLNDPIFSPVSPIIELLAKQRALPVTDLQGRADIDRQIDAFRQYDIRNDLLKYIYRESINQQYAINITGGSKQFSYFLSGGYDKNKDSEIKIDYQRINLRNGMVFRPLKNLEISTDIFYTSNKYSSPNFTDRSGRVINHLPVEPYTRLADASGNHLEIIDPTNSVITPLTSNYRKTAGNGRLLNWIYVPLDDINTNDAASKSQNILMNLNLNYKISPALNASLYYQYGKNTDEGTSFNSIDSYMVRDYVNTFASYSTTNLTAAPTFNVPLGARIRNQDVFQLTNSLRGQLNFSKIWNKVHDFSAIVGAEKREVKQYSSPLTDLFGYNPDPVSFQPLPYNKTLPILNNLATTVITLPVVFPPTIINRNTSVFINAAYTYDRRYTISSSVREDAANIYGVDASRRAKPNWSIGLAWNIANENFFKPGIVQSLKFRATYGYLGNVNNTVSAYPIIANNAIPNAITSLNYATVVNPPNPGLGPERSGIINYGLDFILRNNILSGSIEYYDKRSRDIIAPTPIDPTTGFSSLQVNSANLKTTGFDINLHSVNLKTRSMEWTTNLLFSYTHNVITKYLLRKSDNAADYVPVTSAGSLTAGSYIEGNDPFSLYTYRWAGLDPNTGDPIGYVNGQPSKDYNKIISAKYTDLQNNGSVIPLYYGAFRNTLSWKSFSFSANILYKFDYKLDPPGISYNKLLSSAPLPFADYANRWQKPGDEKITNVPSMVYPSNILRDLFYQGSSARVIRGDHIRLQDIRLSYSFNKLNNYFRNLEIYSNVSNIGIIWRANKVGIDPDTFIYSPAPRMYTLGLNIGF